MKTFKTKKGTELPLASLKGKDYLLIAHRLLWLSEESTNYDISTDFLVLTDVETVARAVVTLFDAEGKVVRKATATKRETKKDFSDHTEKAETGAMGRALAMLGFGTQFAQQDLDEGERLADAPLSAKTTASVQEVAKTAEVPADAPKKERVSSFRRDRKQATSVESTPENGSTKATPSGWR